MHNFTLNAKIFIYFLADLNFDHSVKLTLLEGKLGGFLMLILKWSILDFLHFESESSCRILVFSS